MPKYILSYLAECDVTSIAHFTIEKFGITQARKYRQGLIDACKAIVKNPNIGRDADSILSGHKRYIYKSHVIFYHVDDGNIFVVRILHSSMDIKGHLF
ncbi:MAG: type II toxin-antitoxin system RelE/ParE family toxin [Gammaproteobacteria bacterium]|nr:type II toxin-antitoxin system RelE/ParE family toxin [Gammaproteobacteria bacterium]